MQERIDALRRRRDLNYKGGGDKRINKQHEAGKLTARERLALLFEPDSFQEDNLFARHRCVDFGMAGKELPAEGVVTGVGIVDGRQVYAVSQDFTVAGGSMGEAGARKVAEVMDKALKTGTPLIYINDGAGARIQEGVAALSGYGRIFYRNVLLSGVVPQISIIAGPCAGGAAYSPALTDFIIQVRNQGQMYVTGPKVIEQVTGERVTAEALGGVESHSHYSGVVHLVAENDDHAIQLAKKLMSFLPGNNASEPPYLPELHSEVMPPEGALQHIVPADLSVPYDMRDVIHRIVDGGDFFELQEHFGASLIIGFGRVGGNTIGIVANQPNQRAGVLDIDSADKSSRFIRFCNAFNIPLLTLVDVPGFMPGVRQEYGGIIRHGAKMLFAYASATVPKITVVLRKAYGGAYLAMCAKDMGADKVFAWPTAEIAVMGAEGAVNVLYHKEIAQAEDPEAARLERITEYQERFSDPMLAAGYGLIDEIIEPSETRGAIAAAFDVLASKRELRPQKKHGLIPM